MDEIFICGVFEDVILGLRDYFVKTKDKATRLPLRVVQFAADQPKTVHKEWEVKQLNLNEPFQMNDFGELDGAAF